METLKSLALQLAATAYIVVMMVNVWQWTAGYNLPWSRAAAVLMMIVLLLWAVVLEIKEA